jgi:hypothetical protein
VVGLLQRIFVTGNPHYLWLGRMSSLEVFDFGKRKDSADLMKLPGYNNGGVYSVSTQR